MRESEKVKIIGFALYGRYPRLGFPVEGVQLLLNHSD
jgi:hypothetical protein